MNLIIGQRISTKREDFIITNPTIIYNKCYFTPGNNVYTCSKSKTYIRIELSLWETIRNLSAGQTFEHHQQKRIVLRPKSNLLRPIR